jgi:hypothetical protein
MTGEPRLRSAEALRRHRVGENRMRGEEREPAGTTDPGLAPLALRPETRPPSFFAQAIPRKAAVGGGGRELAVPY